MGNVVLIARPVWPVLRRLRPHIERAGYRVAEAASWSELLDERLDCAGLAGLLLGDYGDLREETAILRGFRDRAGAAGLPVLLVGGMSAITRSAELRAAGADVVVSADTPAESIAEQAAPLLRYGALYQSVEAANRELREQSLQDSLTGLPNRRFFDEDLARNVEIARRIGRPLSCVIADIDDFKRINDTMGHPAGDGVIRHFGAVMRNAKRMGDSVSRIGGDEFAWLLVDADPGSALQAVQRARRLVAESAFEDGGGSVRLTATFGVSSLVPGVDLSADDLVGNADRALYWGKQAGKNVVKFYPPRRAV